MTYEIHAFVMGVFGLRTCKELSVTKANLLREAQAAKLAMIEAIVNAVFSAVHTGTVPPEVLARAESSILASEVVQAHLDGTTEFEEEFRGKVSKLEILPVVTLADMNILQDLKRMQNWTGSVYIDLGCSEEDKRLILGIAAAADISVYQGPVNLGPFRA